MMRTEGRAAGGTLLGRAVFALLLAGQVAFLASAADVEEKRPDEGSIAVVEIRDVLVPVTRDYLERALAEASRRNARLVIIELDTPGGLVTTVRSMVTAILDSAVPVVVHVTPSGASAASGGVFLVLAADVAAMAPISDMGAAHPIYGAGANKPDDILLTKAENELAAFARSLAVHRHRNPDLAEKMVRESHSYSSREALDAGLIDALAADRSELIEWLDGREVVRYDGQKVVLHLDGLQVEPIPRTTREHLLGILSQPTMAFFLLGLGLLGLYVEITHPGALLPGAVGVLSLLLFGLASQLLPVNWLAVALIGVGAGLLLLELKVMSYGALTVGGLGCLVIGGLMLFNGPPELQVPHSVIIAGALSVGLIAV
ncbi:MAG: nodulation protein NfeD, partial [Acidobacteriota bacterium]